MYKSHLYQTTSKHKNVDTGGAVDYPNDNSHTTSDVTMTIPGSR